MDTTSSDPTPASAPTRRGTAAWPPTHERRRNQINTAIVVGLILAGAGVLDGLLMAFERRVVTCEDGHYFPQGTTDFRCFSHPQAGLGIAIAIVSLMLAVIISLVGAMAGWALAGRAADYVTD